MIEINTLSHRPNLANVKANIINIDEIQKDNHPIHKGRIIPKYTDKEGVPLYPYWDSNYSDELYALSLYTVVTSYPDRCGWQEIKLSY